MHVRKRRPRPPLKALCLPFLAGLVLGTLCLEVSAMGQVREPAVAGSFYPGEPDALREAIEGYLKEAEPRSLEGQIKAILAPHAGYMFSGGVAAWAYRQIQGNAYETVVVLSPSHRVPFRGASVMTKGGYRTPLGLVPVDEECCRKLLEADHMIQDIPEAHGPEHALEVQLPFLQTVLRPGWRLVPIIMGSQDLNAARDMAKALEGALTGRRALVVASSDLSHYHSAERAEKMDGQAIQFMQAVDAKGLWEAMGDGKVEACGIGPIMVVLSMAQQAGIKRGTLLKYAHSGHVTGDRSRVVGYASMVWVIQQEAQKREGSAVGVDLGLTQQEKQTLKQIARTTIQCLLDGRPVPSFEASITEGLTEPRGAFVTLEKQHQLRGCIGFIEAVKPLHQTIREMAEAAAFRDPRFPPLSKSEWPEVEIEISVLTPLRQIHDPNEIQVGTHGIYIVKGPFRGLLLPQVATDYGWDRKAFLEHTCMKAGLPTEAWKDPEAKIYIFSADIF